MGSISYTSRTESHPDYILSSGSHNSLGRDLFLYLKCKIDVERKAQRAGIKTRRIVERRFSRL